jgi:hypothetical protein
MLSLQDIKQFFQDWSLTIQAVSVVILVIVTAWYARRTHLMARIMGQEYALKIRPYIKIENTIDRIFNILHNPTHLQLHFHLSNISIIPVGYQVQSITLNGMDITSPPANVFLFPQQNIIYTTKFYTQNAIIINNGDGLKGEIRIEFWTSGLSTDRYFFTRRFVLTPNTTMVTLDEQFGLIR